MTSFLAIKGLSAKISSPVNIGEKAASSTEKFESFLESRKEPAQETKPIKYKETEVREKSPSNKDHKNSKELPPLTEEVIIFSERAELEESELTSLTPLSESEETQLDLFIEPETPELKPKILFEEKDNVIKFTPEAIEKELSSTEGAPIFDVNTLELEEKEALAGEYISKPHILKPTTSRASASAKTEEKSAENVNLIESDKKDIPSEEILYINYPGEIILPETSIKIESKISPEHIILGTSKDSSELQAYLAEEGIEGNLDISEISEEINSPYQVEQAVISPPLGIVTGEINRTVEEFVQITGFKERQPEELKHAAISEDEEIEGNFASHGKISDSSETKDKLAPSYDSIPKTEKVSKDTKSSPETSSEMIFDPAKHGLEAEEDSGITVPKHKISENFTVKDFLAGDIKFTENLEEIAPEDTKFAGKTPFDQIRMAIYKAATENKERIQVTLSPEYLGKVEINLEIENGVLKNVRIYTEKSETLESFVRDSQILEQAVRAIAKDSEVSLNFAMREENAGNSGFSKGGDDSNPHGKVAHAVKLLENSKIRHIISDQEVDIRI